MIERQKAAGFTLVELAIVMVIIGLLIGGILKGGELIQSAKINSTIKEVQSIQSAMNTFRDKYNAMADDMRTATISIPACSADNFCMNGDGDGRVGLAAYPQLSFVVSDQPEPTQFWKHLALADLITGIDTSANWTQPEGGRTHPKSAMGGAYEFFYTPNLYGRWPTHVLRMNRMVITSSTGTTNIGVVSPHEAAQFERKMDDGNSRTGDLIVWEHGDLGCDNLGDGTLGSD